MNMTKVLLVQTNVQEFVFLSCWSQKLYLGHFIATGLQASDKPSTMFLQERLEKVGILFIMFLM